MTDGQTDGQTESIIAKTALCIASYADALSKIGRLPERHRVSESQTESDLDRETDGQTDDLLHGI